MATWNKFLFTKFDFYFFNKKILFLFDLQLEDWGIVTMQLKEPATTWRINGWTEEWVKERNKKNDAVLKAMFVNKYNNTVFDLPDADNNTFYVRENGIAWVQGWDGGWPSLESVM